MAAPKAAPPAMPARMTWHWDTAESELEAWRTRKADNYAQSEPSWSPREMASPWVVHGDAHTHKCTWCKKLMCSVTDHSAGYCSEACRDAADAKEKRAAAGAVLAKAAAQAACQEAITHKLPFRKRQLPSPRELPHGTGQGSLTVSFLYVYISIFLYFCISIYFYSPIFLYFYISICPYFRISMFLYFYIPI